jgi:multiple sugar transport system permease protein
MASTPVLPKSIVSQRELFSRLVPRDWYDTLVGFAFILPFFVLYGAFVLLPILQGFRISLYAWDIIGSNSRFIGLGNYAHMLQDEIFWNSLRNTISFALLVGPSILALAMMLALLLNHEFRGGGLFRTIFYFPNILSVAVIGIIFVAVFRSEPAGFVNAILESLGIESIRFLTSPEIAMYLVALTTVWWEVGFYMLILLAGLQGIPSQLYDAAKVDGANNLQLFRHITLPGLRRPLVFVIILIIISSFQVFGQVDVMTGGGPAGSTRTLMYYMFQRAFTSFQLGYGSAIAFTLFVFLFVVSFVQLKLGSVEEE